MTIQPGMAQMKPDQQIQMIKGNLIKALDGRLQELQRTNPQEYSRLAALELGERTEAIRRLLVAEMQKEISPSAEPAAGGAAEAAGLTADEYEAAIAQILDTVVMPSVVEALSEFDDTSELTEQDLTAIAEAVLNDRLRAG